MDELTHAGICFALWHDTLPLRDLGRTAGRRKRVRQATSMPSRPTCVSHDVDVWQVSVSDVVLESCPKCVDHPASVVPSSHAAPGKAPPTLHTRYGVLEPRRWGLDPVLHHSTAAWRFLPSRRFHQSWQLDSPKPVRAPMGLLFWGDSLRFTPRGVASEHEGGNSHARIAFGEAAPHGADVRSPVHDMYRIPGLPRTFYRPWETDSRRSRGHFRSAEN